MTFSKDTNAANNFSADSNIASDFSADANVASNMIEDRQYRPYYNLKFNEVEDYFYRYDAPSNSFESEWCFGDWVGSWQVA